MAVIVRAAVQSPDTNSLIKASQVSGDLLAGENLNFGAACHIDATTGQVFMTDSEDGDKDKRVIHGYTVKATNQGEPVALFGPGTRVRYSDEDNPLTPGALLYVDNTTPGDLNDTASGVLGEHVFAVGIAVDETDIVFMKLYPVSVLANP